MLCCWSPRLVSAAPTSQCIVASFLPHCKEWWVHSNDSVLSISYSWPNESKRSQLLEWILYLGLDTVLLTPLPHCVWLISSHSVLLLLHLALSSSVTLPSPKNVFVLWGTCVEATMVQLLRIQCLSQLLFFFNFFFSLDISSAKVFWAMWLSNTRPPSVAFGLGFKDLHACVCARSAKIERVGSFIDVVLSSRWLKFRKCWSRWSHLLTHSSRLPPLSLKVHQLQWKKITLANWPGMMSPSSYPVRWLFCGQLWFFEFLPDLFLCIHLLLFSDMSTEGSQTTCLSTSWKIPSLCPRSRERATSAPETPPLTYTSCASPTQASSSRSPTSTESPGRFSPQTPW